MKECDHCGGQLKVIDSRTGEFYVRRRRRCMSCDDRFTTYEVRDDFFRDMILISKQFINLKRRLNSDPFTMESAYQISNSFRIGKKGGLQTID